jgi:hypothetical protein
MHPSPESIKECLDDTCASHPANEAIFRSKKEDSYCKDWQQSAEGRVCHWTNDVFCSCPKFSVVYTNAAFVPIGALAPRGYAIAEQCKYADNYKGKNKRELQDNNGQDGLDATRPPLQRAGGPGGPNNLDGDSRSSLSMATSTALAMAASILAIVL